MDDFATEDEDRKPQELLPGVNAALESLERFRTVQQERGLMRKSLKKMNAHIASLDRLLAQTRLKYIKAAPEDQAGLMEKYRLLQEMLEEMYQTRRLCEELASTAKPLEPLTQLRAKLSALKNWLRGTSFGSRSTDGAVRDVN